MVDRQAPQNATEKVLVMGWLGGFNLGDEMMFDVVRQALSNKQYEVSTITHQTNTQVKLKYTPHFTPRNKLTDEVIGRLCNDNKALFIGGGALFDDKNYQGSLAQDIARVANTFIQKGKPVVIYGVSTNKTLKGADFLNEYREVFKQARYISVRDEYSKKTLEEITRRKDIHLVDDIVFANPKLYEGINKSIPRNKSIKKIAVIGLYNDKTVLSWAKIINKLTHLDDVEIGLINFFNEANNDLVYSAEMTKYIKNTSPLKTIHIPATLEDLNQSLQEYDAVISMRYHGSLVAIARGMKTLMVDYNTHSHYYNKNKYLKATYGKAATLQSFTDITAMDIKSTENLITSLSPNKPLNKKVYKRASKDLKQAINLL